MNSLLHFLKICFISSLLFLFTSENADAQNWTALGAGTNAQIRALTIYNNELIAAGDFTTAGGLTANRIAKWNNTTWSVLGLGTNGTISCIYVLGSTLYAG